MQALTPSYLSPPAPSRPTSTVQAPQSPSAQPSLVPVSRCARRRWSSSVSEARTALSPTSRSLSRNRISVRVVMRSSPGPSSVLPRCRLVGVVEAGPSSQVTQGHE